jgi:hypothetical protein
VEAAQLLAQPKNSQPSGWVCAASDAGLSCTGQLGGAGRRGTAPDRRGPPGGGDGVVGGEHVALTADLHDRVQVGAVPRDAASGLRQLRHLDGASFGLDGNGSGRSHLSLIRGSSRSMSSPASAVASASVIGRRVLMT